MTSLETRRYAMLARVRDFGEAHSGLFPESTEGGQAFAAVNAAVAKLSTHARSKMSTSRDGRQARVAARERLLDRLDAIGRTARAIAEKTPGFDDPFRLPRKQNDELLLTAGHVFVEDAETNRARFVGHGLADTFVADLKALVDKFEKAVRTCAAGKNAQAVAQNGIGTALTSGLAALRQLDVIVANQLEHDPDALAGWEQARRVEYPNRRKSAEPAEPADDTLVPAPAAGQSPSVPAGPVATTPAGDANSETRSGADTKLPIAS